MFQLVSETQVDRLALYGNANLKQAYSGKSVIASRGHYEKDLSGIRNTRFPGCVALTSA
jgi:hypothetical protein